MDIHFFFLKKCLNYRAEKKQFSCSLAVVSCSTAQAVHCNTCNPSLSGCLFSIFIYIYIYIYIFFFSVDFDQQRILVFQIWLYCEFCGIIVLVDEFCVNKICDFKAFSSPIKHMKIFSKCVTKNRKKILFSRKLFQLNILHNILHLHISLSLRQI